MTTSIAETTFTTPCPDWCTLKPGHPADSETFDGRSLRGHGRPAFGGFLFAGAYEYADAPGALEYDVQLAADGDTLTVAQLLDLARNALDAAAWLEAHR